MCRAVDEMRAAIKAAERSSLKYQKKTEKLERSLAIKSQKAEKNKRRALKAKESLAEERLRSNQLEARLHRMTETLRALGVSDEELQKLAGFAS